MEGLYFPYEDATYLTVTLEKDLFISINYIKAFLKKLFWVFKNLPNFYVSHVWCSLSLLFDFLIVSATMLLNLCFSANLFLLLLGLQLHTCHAMQ